MRITNIVVLYRINLGDKCHRALTDLALRCVITLNPVRGAAQFTSHPKIITIWRICQCACKNGLKLHPILSECRGHIMNLPPNERTHWRRGRDVRDVN